MDFILNPFVTLLTFLYSVFNHDMVLAIVVFTVLIRLLTFPLTAQQQRSSAAMQQLQPEMKKLQERYKNDREKLAQEQMRLYREYGINPLGGCLPLIIQFPIFIALYEAIIHALATTPLQLLDLSGRLLVPGLSTVVPMDNMWLGMNLSLAPNFASGSILPILLPVLVVATTWLQFRVTMPPPAPPNADGKQDQAQAMSQSMGTIMPLMYGFFALSFSVGLSIYFIASNTIGIIQYALMGKADFRRAFGLKPKPTDKPAVKLESRTSKTTKVSSNGKEKPTQKADKAKE
ncbi:MAG TPA: YidC/Oxa1 family membrane protein insertase [Phototrophicaceae bacterium]|nr:YidC/Oxa1 family membrane protein insertase [Phototrophicaceae bacterium]